MSMDSATVETLRRAFDESFAAARSVATPSSQQLLAVRIAGDRYALRLDQVGALHADRAIAPLPSPLTELLGLATFRGELAPVYDLGALLGYPRRTQPRWLVLARVTPAIGLGFDLFEGQLVADDAMLVRTEAENERDRPGRGRPHLAYAVRADDGIRPIVDLASLADEIRRRAERARAQAGKRPGEIR